MKKIDVKELRKSILISQGFCEEFPPGKDGVMEVIKRLGYVQLDTINVINRAHLHIFQTRLPDFQEEQLTELLRERKIFEYWTHAASLLPEESFPHTLHRKERFSLRNEEYKTPEFEQLVDDVYKRIKSEGELEVAAFKDLQKQKKEIWHWKPSKIALETLFHQGKVMISGRRKFLRLYDLTQRVYPGAETMGKPQHHETAIYQVRKALTANGMMSLKELGNYLCFSSRKHLEDSVMQMERNGEIEKVSFEDQEMYKLSGKEFTGEYKDKIFIISPFDNLIINRKRLERIFNLKYRLECYVPVAKRKLGYFVLPLLYKDDFIGMIDAKADRKNKVFIIRKLIKLRKLGKHDMRLLETSINEFAVFNSCNKVVWE